MLRLNTFGGLSLVHGDEVVRSHAGRQQRLLPMLALLAAEGARAVSRARIAALLWPDSTDDRARHSLETALSQARFLGRKTGQADLFVRGSAVRLDRHAIAVDLWEFEAAVRAQELERAVALCEGRRFAADVHVDGCDELERHFETLAERYAREYRNALTRLIRRAEATGDGVARVRWAQRLVDAAPEERGAALALVDALQAQQELARALAAAERYQQHLRAIELAPDAEMVARMRQLRAAAAAPSHDRSRAPSGAPDARGATTLWNEGEADRARLADALGTCWRLDGAAARESILTRFPAHDAATSRERVAIHLIHRTLAHQIDRDRFIGALRRAALLQHPHVLPVLDAGTHEELRWFVTPPRAATSLKSLLARERQLPIADAIAIASGVAAALAHAHAQGVVHGDLRPKHVDLPTPRAAVVARFGLVDAIAPEAGADDSSSLAIAFGEEAYHSPEQLRREVVASARSDVYAFGAMMYEMLLGEPPFAPPGARVDILRKLTEAPPELRSRRESVPEALERIVLTCLTRVPADRYSSGVALAEAVATLLS